MEDVKIKNRVMHIVTWCFLATALLFSIFHFGLPIIKRLWMSLCDFWHSIAAYGILLFTAKDGAILPTVQEFPVGMDTVLPLSWEELKVFAEIWWGIFKDEKTILAFVLLVLEKFALILSWISLAMLPMGTIVFVLWLLNRGKDNNYAKNTAALERFEKIRRATWWKAKSAIKTYRKFVFKRWYYWLAFALVWAYNLNFLTIAIELVAWVFYLAWAGTLEAYLNILVQIAKFAVDFSVSVIFIPGWAWAIIIYWLFSLWRKWLGVKRLKKCIKHDEDIIDRYPGAIFVNGKQRSKKTSMLTMLKMLYERRFRKKAKGKFQQRDKQFPMFPWINLERFIDKNRASGRIYLRYHCKQFIRLLRKLQGMPECDVKRIHYFALLKKRYGYTWDDYFFGYDTSYGLEYNNGLEIVHLYDALENYAQLYFIYHQPTPLDLSNLSIREDFTWKDFGNFPVFDGDLLKRDAATSVKLSKYSHIIPFDAFRPGLKFNPENANDVAIEYGIGVIQEVDKERKNSKTRSSAGNKGDGEHGLATQDNDGFETDLKVRGQVAMIDFEEFWVWLMDAQRVGDLGASNAELTVQMFIKGRAEEEFKLPFFEVEDLLFELLTKIYDKIHEGFRKRKGSNVLLHHIIKLIYEPFFKAYDRIQKKFTVWKSRLKVTDGGDGEFLGEEKFYILSYVTYRNRFASDVCKVFYEYRFKKAKKGVDGVDCYTQVDTSLTHMLGQDSYFVEDMTVQNGIASRRRTSRKSKKTKK